VDVYDTILTCDFARHENELPVLAGVPADAWNQGYLSIDGELNTGRLSKTEGYRRILREFGVEPRPDLVRALVDRDRELLQAAARLYDDAIPFLESLRSHGVKIAIIRGELDGKVPAAGTTAVRSLPEVEAMFVR
jgi:FMN phosphatase YigB (HAD superfamily)